RVATLLVVSGPKFCGETAPLITFRQISYQVAPRYLLSAMARSIRARSVGLIAIILLWTHNKNVM
ncbi:TPA: hypothetical protein ACNYX3_001781, partial [Streptococcus pyogenes]